MHARQTFVSSKLAKHQIQACRHPLEVRVRAGSKSRTQAAPHAFSSQCMPPTPSWHNRKPSQQPRLLVRTHVQADKRVVRITVAGPPNQPARSIEVEDPQVVPADVLSFNQIQHELQARQASVSKSEAREQAAIIQAQRQEISSLRQALAETQDVMVRGKQTYNQVMHTKDVQIAQLYELAASGVRERAKLRQEVNEVQLELQGSRRQLHSFMASLMQLKNSMASAGEGDLEHALELLQSSSYSASLNNAGQLSGTNLTEDEVMAQLQQMQQLSETLVQDMRQDEALLSQSVGNTNGSGSSSATTTLDFDSMDSTDMFNKSSGSSTPGSSVRPGTPQQPGNNIAPSSLRNGNSGVSNSTSSAGQHQVPPSNGSSAHGSNGASSNGASGKWGGMV